MLDAGTFTFILKLDARSWMLDAGSWKLDAGTFNFILKLDARNWMLDAGCWMLELLILF
jgi:hypothetical protein